MGKASKRRDARSGRGSVRDAAPPFVGRPFAGLPAETEWVALREFLPAATAQVRLRGGAGSVTLVTLLPMGWAALHRSDGVVLVATQSGATSGDASRDLATAVTLALDAEPGSPLPQVPTPNASTPRLQDLLDLDVPFEVTLSEGFDFWVDEQQLDEEAAAALEQANASVPPTVRVDGAPSVYRVAMGERSFVRWVLPGDEDRATDALSRLHAAHHDRLAPDTRLLGAFRACGLLIPVWEVDRGREAESLAEPVAAMAARLADATASTAALTPDERRARNGILSRQVTLR